MKNLFILTLMGIFINACTKHPDTGNSFIMKKTIKSTVDSLTIKYGTTFQARIEKGVTQVAKIWTKEDGTVADFEKVCMENYIGNDSSRFEAFEHLSNYLEAISGNFNEMVLGLKKVVDQDMGPILPIDQMMASYDPKSHLMDDLYTNKTAFFTILNFPFYSLQEKNELGANWSRKEWAFARLGDIFNSRVPAQYQQNINKALVDAEMYISEYNIYVNRLISNDGKPLFDKKLKLLSHWGLRDEIKANYGKDNGLEKQKLIYEAMKHIIFQDIPEEVINNDKYFWNPYSNKIIGNGKEISAKPEPNMRYQKIIDNFQTEKAIDVFNPDLNTFIKRKFEGEMEISQEDVEKLFIDFISSAEVKKVAELIKKRLGRDLQPFDIWYDGFKARSSIKNEELDATTKLKYPTAEAFKKDLVNILLKLSFTREKAGFIASKVDVDAARGSGHAWGAVMHSQNSHLRTRVTSEGMNYKGYNIAIHEFGHNVEQTFSLQNIDYYTLAGVPNTAFTEALAFVFQNRDLEILGKTDSNPEKYQLDALDIFWSLYECMGVSLLDMDVWKWLYNNPNATSVELKEAVLVISKTIWNKYYAEIFGIKDQVILAIYSHMIENPLYLSAYPIGYLIEFQIEQDLKGRNFGKEIERIFSNGRLTPKEWMKKAVGEEISIKPMLKAVDEALVQLVKK